jgi:uncharacterized membrane protein YfcA
MGLRVAAALTGLVGGLTWIAVLVFDRASADGVLVDALTFAGLFLLGVATLAAGASLVSRGAVWLRVVVAVCFVALVGSILELLADRFDDQAVYTGFGGLAAVVSIIALARSKRPADGSVDEHRTGGTHAR